MLNKLFVFHLKREFFELIKSRTKVTEFRFDIPEGLSCGSRLRFDLGYKSLLDESAHLYATCDGVERIPLRSCPDHVFRCYGIDPDLVVSDSSLIYRISFVLDGDSK